MEVVYKPSELTAALKKFRKKEIVFIDTVGRSPRAKKELTELKKFVDAAEPDETHLVLNVSSNANVLADAVDRFAIMKPNRMIFTKVDESLMLGSILGILRRSRLPISYVTTGQTVPDDIVPADANRMASMIYHGVPAHA
jgi:flagellar biosynthesis protein FlhF